MRDVDNNGALARRQVEVRLVGEGLQTREDQPHLVRDVGVCHLLAAQVRYAPAGPTESLRVSQFVEAFEMVADGPLGKVDPVGLQRLRNRPRSHGLVSGIEDPEYRK